MQTIPLAKMFRHRCSPGFASDKSLNSDILRLQWPATKSLLKGEDDILKKGMKTDIRQKCGKGKRKDMEEEQRGEDETTVETRGKQC